MECPHGYPMQFVKDLGCDECLNDLLDEIEQEDKARCEENERVNQHIRGKHNDKVD